MKRFLLLSCVVVSACAVSPIMEARVGIPRPPLAADCKLRVVDGYAMTTMADYQQVGMITISSAPAGTNPLDPTVRAEIHPRACRLGGDAVSVLGAMNAGPGVARAGWATYVVWARNAAAAPPSEF